MRIFRPKIESEKKKISAIDRILSDARSHLLRENFYVTDGMIANYLAAQLAMMEATPEQQLSYLLEEQAD